MTAFQQPQNTRRPLHQRRGSISASDPFGNHVNLNLNPHRSSSSTLTIVHVDVSPIHQTPSSFSPQEYLNFNPPHKSRSHRRGPSPASQSSQNPRLSFAFSSFSNHGSGGPASPSGAPPASPPIRPSSPSRRHSLRCVTGRPNLTPTELYDLAKQSKMLATSTPSSPVMTAGNLPPNDIGITPTVFTPIPPSVYLPFLDRSAEVAALIASPPTAKLISLLQQTFPKDPSSSSSPSGSTPLNPAQADFPSDPQTWSLTQLISWILIPRSTVPDVLYIQNMRRCILSRSELIWERLKGALGVPPELDIQWPKDGVKFDWVEADESAIESDEDGISEGEKAFSRERLGKSPAKQPPTRDSSESVSPGSPDITTISVPNSPPSPQFPIEGQNEISISPILTGSNPTNFNPPPFSLADSEGDALGDITEAAEEEELILNVDLKGDAAKTPSVAEESPRIHGLRIYTAPLSSTASNPMSVTGFYNSPQVSRAGSIKGHSRPSSSSGSLKGHSRPGSAAHSPQSSTRFILPSAASSPGLYRSGSFGSNVHGASHASQTVARSSSFGSLSNLSFSYGQASPARKDMASQGDGDKDEEDGVAYQGIRDRRPGNPLFPSHFGALAPGPTLNTK
jgi:hypothetical protein